MRRLVGPALVLTLALGACRLELAEVPAIDKASVTTRKTRSTPSPSATATPEPVATAEPAPTPTPTPRATATPSVPTMLLKGQVRIDASYVVSAGGGRIVSNNTGSLIAANAGSLISDKGIGLMGKATLISNNGGGLLSDQGLGFRVQSAPALGTVLPVKGMMVAPVSLLTGAQLGPAVLTDEQGAYAVQVPETQKENVLIVAGIPARDEQDPILADPRLHYSLIAAPKADTGRAIDEDTATVTAYLRRCFVDRLHEVLTTEEARVEAILIDGWSAPELLKTMMLTLMQELRAEAKQIGIDRMTEAQQRALAQRLTGVALAQLDLDAMRMEAQYFPGYTGPLDLAVPAMVDFFRTLRERTTTRLAADAAFFDQQDYMITANTGRATPYRILKPSDLGDFLVEEYMSVNDPKVYLYVDKVLLSLDMVSSADGTYQRTDRLRCAADTIVFKIGEAMLMNTNQTKDKVMRALREFQAP